MAQTGYTPISLYYSTTAAAAPTAGNLVAGELALNTQDEKLYFKNAAGTVKLLASSAGASGDVVGPASATDNAIPTYDGTTGKLIKNNSGVTISSGTITATGFSGPLNGTVGATTPNTGAFTTLSASGVATFSAGSAAAPAITTSGDTNTGIFFPAADTIAFTEGGAEAMRINSSGNVGIGTSSLTGYSLRVGKTVTGAVDSVGVLSNGLVQSDVTSSAAQLQAQIGLAASAFTLSNAFGLYVGQTALSGGAAITSQYGVYVANSLTGATNNYGFYSNIASGTGRWNFYANGTADNYFAGNVGIGTSSPTNKLTVDGNANITGNTTLGDASTDTVTVNGYVGVGVAPDSRYKLQIGGTTTNGVSSYGALIVAAGDSSATTRITGVGSQPTTSASAYTSTDVEAFRALTIGKGAGSTITNAHGLKIEDQTQGTNNYGITSAVSSGANKWNIYASGTAQNLFAGHLNLSSGVSTTQYINYGDGTTNYARLEGGKTASGQGSLIFHTYLSGTLYERMRIDSSGNVGIGVTPTTKLDVSGTSRYTFNVANAYTLQTSLNAAGSAFADDYKNALSHIWQTSGTERMRIDSSGNVGIGTSSPSAKLDIVGSNNTINLELKNSSGANYIQVDNGTANGYFGVSGSNTIAMLSIGTHPLVFGVDGGTERMRIDSSGNVGIGTSSPSTYGKFAVQTQTSNAPTVAITGSGLNPQLNHYINDSTAVLRNLNQIQFVTGSSDISNYQGYMTFSTMGSAGGTISERMRLDSSGNLLIGYTSSNGSYKLQINSQIFATNSTIATSDGQYKENIQTLDGALSLVSQLNPVQFSWKEHPVHNFDRSGPTIGFIAQEVEQVLVDKPYLNSIIKRNECVIEPEEKDAEGNITKEAVTEEFLGIAEGNMIALLTKAIQELKAELDTAKASIAALETQ